MIRAVAITAVVVGLTPSPRPLFEVVEEVGTLKFVRANRAGAGAYNALRALEELGAFRLKLEVADLRKTLESQTVSLSFEKMEAVTVAELIAASAGLDLITQRLEPDALSGGPGQLVATVVRAPSAATEAGRQRLRDWALRWYRNLLKVELRKNRETADAEDRIHIDLALLDMAQGNLAAAASEFQWFTENAPKHPYVPHALLKEAECYLEMGQLVEASQRSRRVMTNYRSHEVGVRAAQVFARTGLLRAEQEERAGRAALAASTLDTIVLNLELFLWGFRDREEFPGLLLLLGEAQRRRGRPDLVLEKIRQLESVVEIITLPDAQWATANFLRGGAEIAAGDAALGEKLLWRFIRKKPQDQRVPSAWVSLAEAQLALDDPLQCLFAARKALAKRQQLLALENERAFILQAKSLLGLGKLKEAVDLLQGHIRKGGAVQHPGLAVWLAGVLLDRGRAERAKALLEPLALLDGEHGDRARLMLVEAEARQGNDERVVERALAFAKRIRKSDVSARLAELVGDAYKALGMKRLAAEAYNGRLR